MTIARADAHIHLFDGGYQGSLIDRLKVPVNEAKLYMSFAETHGVTDALVVAYEGPEWARGNNEHLVQMAAAHAWVHPVAYFDPAAPPDTAALEGYHAQGFVGLSTYVFGDEQAREIGQAPDGLWQWITEHHWLLSVNSTDVAWGAWLPILKRHPQLRLLASHLGLPPPHKCAPSIEDARAGIAPVLALAEFPGPRVKLSGFYAISDPGHDFPHTAAWPYVELLLDRFGSERLLWASDCTPCLDWLTFPQTYDLFRHMPFMSDAQRTQIEGANLMTLLTDTRNE